MQIGKNVRLLQGFIQKKLIADTHKHSVTLNESPFFLAILQPKFIWI